MIWEFLMAGVVLASLTLIMIQLVEMRREQVDYERMNKALDVLYLRGPR